MPRQSNGNTFSWSVYDSSAGRIEQIVEPDIMIQPASPQARLASPLPSASDAVKALELQIASVGVLLRKFRTYIAGVCPVCTSAAMRISYQHPGIAPSRRTYWCPVCGWEDDTSDKSMGIIYPAMPRDRDGNKRREWSCHGCVMHHLVYCDSVYKCSCGNLFVPEMFEEVRPISIIQGIMVVCNCSTVYLFDPEGEYTRSTCGNCGSKPSDSDLKRYETWRSFAGPLIQERIRKYMEKIKASTSINAKVYQDIVKLRLSAMSLMGKVQDTAGFRHRHGGEHEEQVYIRNMIESSKSYIKQLKIFEDALKEDLERQAER